MPPAKNGARWAAWEVGCPKSKPGDRLPLRQSKGRSRRRHPGNRLQDPHRRWWSCLPLLQPVDQGVLWRPRYPIHLAERREEHRCCHCWGGGRHFSPSGCRLWGRVVVRRPAAALSPAVDEPIEGMPRTRCRRRRDVAPTGCSRRDGANVTALKGRPPKGRPPAGRRRRNTAVDGMLPTKDAPEGMPQG